MEGTCNYGYDNDRVVVDDDYDDDDDDDDDADIDSFATSFIENVLRGRRRSTIFLRRENTRAPIWKGA